MHCAFASVSKLPNEKYISQYKKKKIINIFYNKLSSLRLLFGLLFEDIVNVFGILYLFVN